MAAIDKVFETNIMEALYGHVESFEDVTAAIQRLDRESHVLVHMRYMREFTDEQIASILSIPVEQVGAGVEKALETLKRIATPSR
jgi:DNA-directed RNA polymerase specialized sigma24 family protein